jgi:hypothetical protein
MQLAFLERGDFQFIEAGVSLGLLNLALQRLMAPFKFRKMRFNGHSRLHVSRNVTSMTQKANPVEGVPGVTYRRVKPPAARSGGGFVV